MKKDLRVSELCDLYGQLLTTRQLEILKNYYDYDLSLAEISENSGVTRQAVRDAIVKAGDQLNAYESALGLLSMKERLGEISNALLAAYAAGDTESVKRLAAELKSL